MTWTDADTEALRAVAPDIERHCDFPDVGEATLISRAATEIRRLQARVEEQRAGAEGLVVSYQRRIAYQVGLITDLSRRLDTLEAERAEVAREIVAALRERADRLDRESAAESAARWLSLYVAEVVYTLRDIADEIEAGAFPPKGEQ